MQSPNPSKTQYRTIFHEILNSKLPPEEKAIPRLGDEASVTLAAGTLTTSWTLSVALYYLLTTPSVLQKLKAELESGTYFSCSRVIFQGTPIKPLLQVTDSGLHHSYSRYVTTPNAASTRRPTLSRSLRSRSHPTRLRRFRAHLSRRPRRTHGPHQLSNLHSIYDPTRNTNKHDNHAAPPRRAHLPVLQDLPSRALAREPASRQVSLLLWERD